MICGGTRTEGGRPAEARARNGEGGREGQDGDTGWEEERAKEPARGGPTHKSSEPD